MKENILNIPFTLAFNLFHDGGRYHIEPMDWFLYDNGLRHERVNQIITAITI